jgi:hypothetical protein
LTNSIVAAENRNGASEDAIVKDAVPCDEPLLSCLWCISGGVIFDSSMRL